MERACVNEMVSGQVLEQPRSHGPPLPVPTEEVAERTWERGWFYSRWKNRSVPCKSL